MDSILLPKETLQAVRDNGLFWRARIVFAFGRCGSVAGICQSRSARTRCRLRQARGDPIRFFCLFVGSVDSKSKLTCAEGDGAVVTHYSDHYDWPDSNFTDPVDGQYS